MDSTTAPKVVFSEPDILERERDLNELEFWCLSRDALLRSMGRNNSRLLQILSQWPAAVVVAEDG